MAWSPRTRHRTPHDVHNECWLGRTPLVADGALHWLCRSDTSYYIFKLDVGAAAQVTSTELPASFNCAYGRCAPEHLLSWRPRRRRATPITCACSSRTVTRYPFGPSRPAARRCRRGGATGRRRWSCSMSNFGPPPWQTQETRSGWSGLQRGAASCSSARRAAVVLLLVGSQLQGDLQVAVRSVDPSIRYQVPLRDGFVLLGTNILYKLLICYDGIEYM